MPQITIYADDSCWWQKGLRSFVEPIIGVGKRGTTLSWRDAYTVIRFPDNMATTLQNAKINSCEMIFTASTDIDRIVHVNFTTTRPNPSQDSLSRLQRYVTDSWETIGFIEKGVRQDESTAIQIQDKDILLRILRLGLVFFSIDDHVGVSFLYSSRAAMQTNAPRLVIDYFDNSTPPKVETISPKPGTVDGEKPITFTWKYFQDVGTPQTHYSLQYSRDGGVSWISLAEKQASNKTSHTIPKETLPNGSIQWRVRAWSAGGIASDWASSIFLVRSSPKAPSISSIGSTPRPIIQWKSANQQAFQVEVPGYYQSGTIFGAQNWYQIPEFLPDGKISIRVRIQNELGLWSPWASVSAVIVNDVNEETYSIALSARPMNGGVELKWDTRGNFARYYVYRDGEPIAEVAGTLKTFTDYLSAERTAYQVRAVLQVNDNYLMSGSIREAPRMEDALLSPLKDIHWISLSRNRGGPPVRERQATRQTAYFHYEGRALPVAQVSDFLEQTSSFQYTLKNEDARLLENLCGELVILKDRWGRRVIGILNDLDFTQGKLTDVSFTITAVDYKEFAGYEN